MNKLSKDDLGLLPEPHPREKLVDDAEIELHEAIVKITKNLTRSEYLQVLNNVFHGVIANIAKYAIRHERHGSNSDKPGGLK